MWALRATRAVAARSRRSAGYVNPNENRLLEKDITPDERPFIEIYRPMVKPPPLPKEQQQRLRERMIRFGKLRRMQHNEMHRRQNDLMRAKWRALDALPNRRRKEALETKPPEIPVALPMTTETPPIEGFNITDFSSSTT